MPVAISVLMFFSVPGSVCKLSCFSPLFSTLLFGRLRSVLGAFRPHLGALGPQIHSKYAVSVIVFRHLAVFASGTFFSSKMAETEPKGAPKQEVRCLHFSRTSFFWPRGRRETVQNRPRSAPRGPGGLQEGSRAAFGGLRASFWSLRDLFFRFLLLLQRLKNHI